MNDRYGVDPCAAASVGELAGLLRQFGPQHGRFIFDFPPDWYAEVRNHFQGEGEIRRAQLVELWLRMVRRSLLPTRARYSSTLPWAQNAAHLVADAKGLIGPAGSKPPCRGLEDVLVDPGALPDCRGEHIPRTARAYVDAARPLLQISSKVVLVDPHFRLRYRVPDTANTGIARRHSRSLTALLKAAQEERKVEVFKIMVSPIEAMIDSDGGARFEKDLAQVQSDASAGGICLEYDLLDTSNPLDRHPRYLLGNQCGLRFDWGFDTGDDGSTNHVEWVGDAALTPLLDHFM
jgi:hypothetical protein